MKHLEYVNQNYINLLVKELYLRQIELFGIVVSNNS